jgi:oligo-1,6-glucosidase
MPDAPITDPNAEIQFAGYQYCNGPRIHEFLSEMNSILVKYDAMTVGECPHTHDPAHVLRYVSAKEKQLDMVFQFDVVDIGMGPHKFQTTPFNWKLPAFKKAIAGTQNLIRGTDAWTTVFLENHDQSRSISRFGSDTPELRGPSGKMLAMMLMALSGTLFIYQGQEIGQINFPVEWDMEEYKDVDSTNYYNMVKERTNGNVDALKDAKAALQHLARDHARTPMQWDARPNGGFSTAKPWMRVNDDYPTCNVRQQQGEKKSVLAFWKTMLKLRKEHADLFVYGDFDLVRANDENIFYFTKERGEKRALVVLNFTKTEQSFQIPAQVAPTQSLLLAASVDKLKEGVLLPFEGRIYLI